MSVVRWIALYLVIGMGLAYWAAYDIARTVPETGDKEKDDNFGFVFACLTLWPLMLPFFGLCGFYDSATIRGKEAAKKDAAKKKAAAAREAEIEKIIKDEAL